MSNEQSVFTFDIEESLSFRSGAQIQDLLGIALEPEISIQEFDTDVSVRGVIELSGEYYPLNAEVEGEAAAVSPTTRDIESVEVKGEGTNSFFHRFPVEISVPKYRVTNLNDVWVGIEAFDYEIPGANLLELRATVAIYGISAEKPAVKEEAEQPFLTYEQPDFSKFMPDTEPAAEQDEAEEPDRADENEETIAFEQESEPIAEEKLDLAAEEEQGDQETPIIPGVLSEAVPEDFQLDMRSSQEEEEGAAEAEDEPNAAPEYFRFDYKEKAPEKPAFQSQTLEPQPELPEEDRWKYKETKTFSEFFGNKPMEPAEVPAVNIQEDEVYNDDVVYEAEEEHFEDSVSAAAETAEKEAPEVRPSAEEQESAEESEESEESSLLVSMFGAREESFTSVRMIIVQERDTLEKIASKYDVPVSSITSTNGLEEEALSEGQLLVIPRKKPKDRP